MNEEQIRHLAEGLKGGVVSIDEFVAAMKARPFEEVGGEIKLDKHRALRKGFAEIIYCPGKSDEQLRTISQALADTEENVLFSRCSREQYGVISAVLSDAVYHDKARLTGLRRKRTEPREGITVVTAGSSDVPVAEEAAVTAEYMGCVVKRIYDVGIAGLHRLLAHVEEFQNSRVIVAVAGMEGALPSVIGGLVSCPVVAVPTSVGYGANFGGVSALLTMINSCATGVTVTNIDNGLGAGFFAARVLLTK